MTYAQDSGRLPLGVPIVLWIVAPVLLALSAYRPFGESQGRAASLPKSLAGFSLVSDYEIKPRYRQLLGTSDAAWRAYRDDQSKQRVFVTAVFHEQNWKSVHPPHICLEGSGMAIVADDQVHLSGADVDDLQVGRIVTFARKPQRYYLSLYLFGTRKQTMGEYSSFFWSHAPRAVLRQATSGFLLRVETYLDGRSPDQIAAGQAVVERLLRAMRREAMERVQ